MIRVTTGYEFSSEKKTIRIFGKFINRFSIKIIISVALMQTSSIGWHLTSKHRISNLNFIKHVSSTVKKELPLASATHCSLLQDYVDNLNR